MANPVLEGDISSPFSIFSTYTAFSNADMGSGSGLPIGTRGTLQDRTFHWAKFIDGTAIGPNKLAQMAAPVAEHVSESNDPFVAGTTRVPFTPAGVIVSQNQYKDGYIKVEGGTAGIGQMYKLKSHGFKDLSTATTFDLYDEVQTTTTGSEVATLVSNPYSGVVIQPANNAITAPCAGLTLTNFAAAATATVATPGYMQTAGTVAAPTTWTQPRYGWLQTWGPASCLLDTTALVAGSGIRVGAVAGSCGVAVETEIMQKIGVAMEAMTTDNIYASVFLMLAP